MLRILLLALIMFPVSALAEQGWRFSSIQKDAGCSTSLPLNEFEFRKLTQVVNVYRIMMLDTEGKATQYLLDVKFDSALEYESFDRNICVAHLTLTTDAGENIYGQLQAHDWGDVDHSPPPLLAVFEENPYIEKIWIRPIGFNHMLGQVQFTAENRQPFAGWANALER